LFSRPAQKKILLEKGAIATFIIYGVEFYHFSENQKGKQIVFTTIVQRDEHQYTSPGLTNLLQHSRVAEVDKN